MFDEEKAVEAAMKYCIENNLSPSRLMEQYRQVISDKMYFAQPKNMKTNGLKTDIISQPLPTLVVDSDYSVSRTENTKLLR